MIKTIALSLTLMGLSFYAGRRFERVELLTPLVVNNRIQSPDITPTRIPYPICFGKTIYGDGVVVDHSWFDDSPLMIVGNNTTINDSEFHGGRYGIYIYGENELTIQGQYI